MLTTLTIVGIVAGAGYRLLIVPLLDRLEAQRKQDGIEFTGKWNTLFDTLGELKEEMKQSRAERTESATTFMMLTTRLESMEKRINGRNCMNIPPRLMDSAKKVFQSVRVANIHPTGVLATRALVLVMLIPILLVITQYIMSFIAGYVSDEANKLINVGLNIIDHIFIPSVLMAIVGFLGLWLDKDGNGIPDKLEEQQKVPPMIERGSADDKR